MRHLRIFFLHLQYIFYQRARSFVWFVIVALNPLLNLSFLLAAIKTGNNVGISAQSAITYYFLLFTLSAFIVANIEKKVATQDIQLGRMSSYLLKPYSYFWTSFFQEIPYRLLQGIYGLIITFIFALSFKNLFVLSNDLQTISLASIIFLLAVIIFFIMKMAVGLIAFWIVDIDYFDEFVSITFLIFGGGTAPLTLFPSYLQRVAEFLPFPYLLYYPITAFQGKYDIVQSFQIITIQLFWLGFFAALYYYMWNKGIKKFTAVGN